MAKIHLYRNSRDGRIQLRFCNGHREAVRTLDVSLQPNQWKDGRVVNHPQAATINASLDAILAQCQVALLQMVNNEPTRNMPAGEMRDRICKAVFNDVAPFGSSFFDVYDTFTRTHTRAGTRSIYNNTRAVLKRYDRSMEFATISRKWLQQFDLWMTGEGFSVNYRSIHMRNIRAVLNYAIDAGMDVPYPFRHFAIKSEQVIPRDLTMEEMHKLVAYQGEWKEWVDMFLICFGLIGINVHDLFDLTAENIHRGRLYYTRAKTGRGYNIKVWPPVSALLKRYKGNDRLLAQFDGISREWAMKKWNHALAMVGKELHIRLHMSTYVARYTWSTVAHEDLGFSFDAVSQALGHSVGLRVTKGYVHIKEEVVDEMNKAVLQAVFGDF